MKKLLSLILGVALTFSVAACEDKKESNPTDKPTIKIGATLPLTGDAAEAGQAAMKAIKLAASEWNSKNTKYNYEIVFEDDAVKPKQGLLNAQKLINLDKVRAILTQWTPVGATVSPLSEKNGVIHFTCSIGDVVSQGKYNFNHYTSFEEQAKALIEKLKEEKIKNLSYVIVNTTGCIEQSDFMIEALKNQNINLIDVEYYNPNEKDFRLLISKLEAKKPDYYLFCSIPPSAQIFLSQFKQSHAKHNITSIDTFLEMGSENTDLVEGLWYVNSASGTETFREAFKEKTGADITSCTANLYDATNLLITAYESTSLRETETTPQNEDVIKTLHSIKHYDGAVGDNLSIDSAGVVVSKAAIKIIQNSALK